MAKVKDKACKICKAIYSEGDKCPKCGSKEFTESQKGKIFVINQADSEIAEKLSITTNGEFAIKTR